MYHPFAFLAIGIGQLDHSVSLVGESSEFAVLQLTVRSSVHEMCHKLPAILSNRVFPVLVLTAKRGRHAFIIVQIPVDVSSLTAAMYSNGRNRQDGDCALKRKKPVLGCGNESLAYT